MVFCYMLSAHMPAIPLAWRFSAFLTLSKKTFLAHYKCPAWIGHCFIRIDAMVFCIPFPLSSFIMVNIGVDIFLIARNLLSLVLLSEFHAPQWFYALSSCVYDCKTRESCSLFYCVLFNVASPVSYVRHPAIWYLSLSDALASFWWLFCQSMIILSHNV